MVIRLFLNNRVWVLLFLPFVLSLYILGDNLGMDFPFGKAEQSSLILPFFSSISWVQSGAHIVMILVNAVLLNWVFNSNEFLEKNTFMISLLYIIISSFFQHWGASSWLFVAHLFCILGLWILIGIKPQQSAKKPAFNAGVIFGLSLFFEPKYFFLLPIVLLLLVNARGFHLRELILLIVGFFLPMGFYWATSYLTGSNLATLNVLSNKYYDANWKEVSILAFLLLMLFFSIAGLRARLAKASLRLKKQTQLLTIFMFYIVLLGSLTFFWGGDPTLLSLISIPFSFYFTYALLSSSLGVSSHLFFYILLSFSLFKYMLFYF